MNKQFVHVVNFWLRKDLTPEERQLFETSVLALGAIDNLVLFHVGKPASTDRPVIDRSYNYNLVCVFKNKADHDAYQIDAIHDTFRDTCTPLWEKVVIYDSEGF